MGKGNNKGNNSNMKQGSSTSPPRSGTKRGKAPTPPKTDEKDSKSKEKKQKDGNEAYDVDFSAINKEVKYYKDDVSTKLQGKFNEVANNDALGHKKGDRKKEIDVEMVDRPTEVHQPNSKMKVDEVVEDANDDHEDCESEYDLADMWDKLVACKKAGCERAIKHVSKQTSWCWTRVCAPMFLSKEQPLHPGATDLFLENNSCS